MSAAILDIDRPVEARRQLTEAECERIRAEQRHHNLSAIRLCARECPARVSVPPALVDVIEYWQGDGPAISAGHLALTRLGILLEHSRLSDIAAWHGRTWLADARRALERFETPWGAQA